MQKYETMVILSNNLEEEARKALLESLLDILKSNGATVSNVNEWGTREFAYEIDKETRGYYVVVDFETDNSSVNAEFVRLCEINPNVIRQIVIAKP